MTQAHDPIATLADRIAAAPFAPETWPSVLGEIARVTGGWGGQLIAAEPARFLFLLASDDISQDMLHRLDADGGADPTRNPRAAVAFAAQPMVAYTDAETIPEPVRARNPIYNGLYEEVDAGHALASVLEADGPLRIMITTNRTRRSPTPDARQLRTFCGLLPGLRASAKLQIKLEDRGAALAMGVLDQLGGAAIACDHNGRVVSLTPAAEAMLRSETFLLQRNGVLRAAIAESDRDLSDAISGQVSWRRDVAPRGVSVLLRAANGRELTAADVVAMPKASGAFGLGGGVLVVMGAVARERPDTFLQKLGLSATEAQIAHAAARGLSVAELAQERMIAVDTVRSHLKAVYGKLAVHSQRELAARLRPIL